jgi:hypothetical protein
MRKMNDRELKLPVIIGFLLFVAGLLEPVLKVPKYARRCDKFKVPKLATLEA